MDKRAWMMSAAMVISAAAAPAAAQQLTPTFDEVVSFGDSFSDIGNLSNAITPGVFNSHTTNPGNTTVENVAEHYGVDQVPSVIAGGRNYAVSGARVVGVVNPGPGVTPATAAQIPNYLGDVGGVIGPRTLVTFIAGGNDVTLLANRVSQGLITPEQAVTEARAAAATAVQQLGELQTAGARIIIVGSNAGGTSATVIPIADAYNDALDEGLAGRTGIVPVNIGRIMGGILSDPARFGLTNTTDPACTVPNALYCTASTLVAPNADQTYFLSDATHPSSATHRMVADVIIAQLAAPQQMSLLAETPLGLTAAHRSAAAAALLNPDDGRRAFATVSIVGQGFERSFDTTDANDLGFSLAGGVRFDLRPDVKAGFAASFGRTLLEFDGGSEFDTNALIGSAFVRRELGEDGYLMADVYAGVLAYSSIERTFAVGVGRHTEEGATLGSAFGASIAGAWWFGQETRHGPFARADMQRISVDAYSETVHPGSAMTFGDQERDSLVGELGWQVTGEIARDGGVITPFAALSYAREFEGGQRLVTAGLVTMNGTFALPGFTPSEDWVSLRAGAAFQVMGAYEGSIGYEGRFAADQGGQHLLSFSLTRPF